MVEATEIDMVEKQSYSSASVAALHKPSSGKSDSTPMDLGKADVISYKCGKRGHMVARCYAKLAVCAKMLSKKSSYPNGGAKN